MLQIKSLTKEQAARFPEWVAKWTEIGLSTERTNFNEQERAVLDIYQACKLTRPRVLLRLHSPFGVTLGGALAVLLVSKKQVESQVRSQVQSQVWSQVESQVWSQVWSQVGSQVRSQVQSQVGSQVGLQVRSQVQSQVQSQVWSQVRSQVGSHVGLQVRSQVQSQVGSQVESHVGLQVRSQVWSQVGSHVGSQVQSQVESGFDNYWGSQFWASWYSYISFFRDVCQWTDPVLEQYALGEALKDAGWIWWHEAVCAISDRPIKLNRDERGRLHSSCGMAIEYGDGWGLYSWHGVRVTAQIIEQPHTLSAEQILSESNAEVRRVMVERLGLDQFLSRAKAKVLHTDQGGKRVLHRIDWRDDEPIVAVQVTCPTTGQVYFLRVPPQMDRCDKAVAWTFGFEKVRDYAPTIET